MALNYLHGVIMLQNTTIQTIEANAAYISGEHRTLLSSMVGNFIIPAKISGNAECSSAENFTKLLTLTGKKDFKIC